jgi:NitT/TauT family transport system ATP-binding protein
MRLIVDGVSHAYQSGPAVQPILSDISFETGSGEFLTIFGPSGCGKTTLLKLIAQALPVQTGSVLRTNTADGGAGGTLLVRQEHSLFPWMTALDNACFGLRMQGAAKAHRETQALELFERFGLSGWHDAYPHQLSAGMKQRVALIRGFISRPAMLLMDEPFSALDSQTRDTLQRELLTLWARWANVGVVFVTHDVDEALLLSDRILVLRPRPASIAADVRVPFVRPRSRAFTLDPAVIALKAQLLRCLAAGIEERRA